MSTLTCAGAGLRACDHCGLVSRAPVDARVRCPRCGALLHGRQPNSVQITWALLFAACLLYLPAMLLPVMRVDAITGSSADTIMSGVALFLSTGSWHLALVIFVASVVVPMGKLVVLSLLLASVQRGSRWRPLDRTRLYAVVEAAGRWSMVDVYVIALTVTLVQLRGLASIHPGPGALAFGAVVVLTMLAALRFDPRLIWDPLRGHEHG